MQKKEKISTLIILKSIQNTLSTSRENTQNHNAIIEYNARIEAYLNSFSDDDKKYMNDNFQIKFYLMNGMFDYANLYKMICLDIYDNFNKIALQNGGNVGTSVFASLDELRIAEREISLHSFSSKKSKIFPQLGTFRKI